MGKVFDEVNEKVYNTDTHFEDLQNLCLDLANRIEKQGQFEPQVMPKTGAVNFKYNFGDRAWIKDLECYGRVLSCWHTSSGLQYEMRYFIGGKHETSYLFEDELLTEKP